MVAQTRCFEWTQGARVTALLFALSGVLAGCATAGIETHLNRIRATPPAPAVERARFAPSPRDDAPEVFVGVSMSGGGSRAANFAAAVLEQLQDLGFLDDLKVLSSVSGGSIAGAYYALHSSELARDPATWRDFKAAMRTNIRDPWQSRVLAPGNVAKAFSGRFNRTEALGEILDDTLYHGATFGSLGSWAKDKPILLVNATDITRNFSSLAFTQENFDLIASDFASFPISRAVAASAAFPGAFNSVALKDFRRADGPARYQHLMDGGPSDNLGIGSLSTAARQFFRAALEARFGRYAGVPTMNAEAAATDPALAAPPASRTTLPFACLFIVIDAYVPLDAAELSTRPDPRRSLIDRVVLDPNLLYAYGSLLFHRRAQQIRSFPNVPLFDAPQDDVLNLEHYERREPGFAAIPSCAVWHIALADTYDPSKGDTVVVANAPNADFYTFRPKPEEVGSDGYYVRQGADGPVETKGYQLVLLPGTPHAQFLRELFQVVSKIDTDLKLRGPPNCSPETLQSAIYAAARVLVHDSAARTDVCAILKRGKNVRRHRCDEVGAPTSVSPWPVQTSGPSGIVCVPGAP